MIVRNELNGLVAKKSGYSKKDVSKILSEYCEVIKELLGKGEEIRALDGLTLYTKHVAPRTARNPSTGEMIDVPAKRVPKARFGKNIKEAIGVSVDADGEDVEA